MSEDKAKNARTVRLPEAIEFAEIYNDTINYPTIANVGFALMMADNTVRNLAVIYRKAYKQDSKYPKIIKRKRKSTPEHPALEFPDRIKRFTKEYLIEVLQDVHKSNGSTISKHLLHDQTEIEQEDWEQEFGTFSEYKSQAGIINSKAVRKHATHVAQHVAGQHYRGLNVERSKLDSVYDKPTGGKYQTVLVCSDIHDVEVDPFYLRILLDTAARIQPDVICINGDALDLPEFGKYGVDPREWDVAGRIKFLHEKVLEPLRELCPDAQIDYVEGNHEARLLIHLADASPALQSVLSDLHGFTVPMLLGLDKYEINYFAKADLQARSKSDLNKELKKNFKVYNDQFMCHHFPSGRHYGLPGVSGHHHAHLVWSEFNHTYGSYQWHQSGCGHLQDASYCAGEKWNLGFVVATLDTLSKRTTMDYIDIGDTHAVSAGKIYERQEHEAFPIPFH